jgi:putative tricarboxylic transport membrane protein
MKFKPQVLFSVGLLIFFIVFVYLSFDWRLQARLYPWAIGFPMIILAVVHIFNELFEKDDKPQQSQSQAVPVDRGFSSYEHLEQGVARKRTIVMFSWIVGFYLGIWLFGFRLMVPAFVFLYLKVQSHERWTLSIVLTAFAWLLFWGLFDWLLSLPFPDGKVQTWLGLT